MQTTKEKFIEAANKTILRLEEELRKDMSQRIEKTTDKELIYILSKVNNMKECVTENKLPPKNMRYLEITRLINDGWPSTSELGDVLTRLEYFYRNDLS